MPPDDRPAPDRLLRAAIEVLRARGLSGATTRAVTEAAGVGRGLLNHYFRWSALRAAAWAAIMDAAAAAWFDPAEDPPRALEAFLDGAFDDEARPVWALWAEALDLARADPALLDALRQAQARHAAGLGAVLAAGHAIGAWRCADPSGAALRLLALHDGLIVLLLSGVSPLSPGAGRAHLEAAARLETGRQPAPIATEPVDWANVRPKFMAGGGAGPRN